MGAAPEVRLVIKHTFLEFVEEGAPLLGKPFRQRAFTDSALAEEDGGRRQQPLNVDTDNLVNVQELPTLHLHPEPSAASSSAYNSGDFRVNRDATEEVKAVLGMMPHGRGDASSLASSTDHGPPVTPQAPRNRAARRGQKEDRPSGATDMPAVEAVAAPPPQQRSSTWTVRPMAPSAHRGASGSAQAPAAAKARTGLKGGARGGDSIDAFPREAEGSDSVPNVPDDQLTTVLFRNLPREFTRAMFLDLVNAEGFAGAYNFVYTPVDFTSQAGLGYAFINFTSPSVARVFWNHFDGFSRWPVPNDKVGALNWSSPHQGLTAHVERYKNSPVMHSTVPDEWKPAVFVNGVRVAFPAPTKVLKAPKIRHGAGGAVSGP